MPAQVTMSDSILTSIKKSLNIGEGYEAFDSDIVLLINSTFSILTQLGVGPETGFSIEDKSSTWDEFIDGDTLNMVYQYVFLRVKLSFDPPTGTVLSCMENQIKELDWRLSVAAEEVKKNEQ